MTRLFLVALLLSACGSGPTSTAELPTPGSATIQLRVTDTRVFIPLTVNGVTVECMLDTGAPTIFISRRIAERVRATELYDVDGDTLYSYGDVSLGPWTFEEPEFWGRGNAWYDCLVGLRPLLGHVITIDLVNQELRVK